MYFKIYYIFLSSLISHLSILERFIEKKSQLFSSKEDSHTPTEAQIYARNIFNDYVLSFIDAEGIGEAAQKIQAIIQQEQNPEYARAIAQETISALNEVLNTDTDGQEKVLCADLILKMTEIRDQIRDNIPNESGVFIA